MLLETRGLNNMDYKEAQKKYRGWKHPEVIIAFGNISNKIFDLAVMANLSEDDKNKILSDLITLDHHLTRWCK